MIKSAAAKERAKLVHKLYKANLKDAGLCLSCRGPAIEGSPLCRECRIAKTRREKFSRDGAKLEGFCRCRKFKPEVGKKFCAECLERGRDAQRRSKAQATTTIINHFDGKCACCGESLLQFLTIDHVNNDGHIERKLHNNSGNIEYIRLAKRIAANEVITDRQLLCYNCNLGKARNGGTCPHQFNGLDMNIINPHKEAALEEWW